MKIVKSVICSQCGKKQVSGLPDLLQDDLFWRTCEFCRRFGLKLVVTRRLTLREWMEALYWTIGFQIMAFESFLKKR